MRIENDQQVKSFVETFIKNKFIKPANRFLKTHPKTAKSYFSSKQNLNFVLDI